MPSSKNIYANLRAEMARRNIRLKDIAECIGKGVDATSRKLSKTGSIRLAEALKIKKTFFSDKPLEDLFKEEK